MPDLRPSPTDDVIGIGDEEADEVLDALSTESAREILVALNDGPATVAELADRTGLTAQNASYHLGKLTDSDLVQKDGTSGTGGNEATVYAPARSVVVSTNAVDGRGVRLGVAGLVAGGVLSFVCLSSLVGAAVSPVLGLHELLLLVTLW